MAEVILEKVVKDFGGLRAVDNVSLTIADGEFFTLLGPSGCGKTTTLRLIAGLEYADAGRVLIGDREVTRTPPARRGIAMVFQAYALYPHMTIAENIGYPLRLRKIAESEIKTRVERIAERLRIRQVLDRKPSAISGGQQQRAAVARAMVQEPLVYLFDEPLSNLDARLRLESRRFLKQILKETAGTAVYVTHDQTEAMALSDRVGVMKDGKLAQVAPPAELYLRPASTFIAGFVGHLPMNLASGEAKADAGLWFVVGDFRVRIPDGIKIAAGSKLTLGIRPEDLTLGGEGGLAGMVEDVEPLGSEEIVTVGVGGISWLTRLVSGPAPRRGEPTRLTMAPEKMHFFDEQGDRIG